MLLTGAVLAMTVSGAVLSGAGPVAGARVTLYGASATISRSLGATTTARDGTFRLAASAAAQRVVYAIATGGAPPRRPQPNAVQIDPSGNVWVTNNIETGMRVKNYAGGDGLVEFIGLAAPVKTPLIGLPRRP